MSEFEGKLSGASCAVSFADAGAASGAALSSGAGVPFRPLTPAPDLGVYNLPAASGQRPAASGQRPAASGQRPAPGPRAPTGYLERLPVPA